MKVSATHEGCKALPIFVPAHGFARCLAIPVRASAAAATDLDFAELVRWFVERWFRKLTDKRIRRDSFDSVPDLIATIEDYILKSNQNPHIFVWTASVEKILATFAKCKEALDALR